jgi:GDP-L-fucose synthase
VKIFLTGGSGFLGKEVIKALIDLGYHVDCPSSKQCNLLEMNSLKKYSVLKYDHIYHLAAWTQAGDFCLKYPGEQWINNQLINTNIINWWRTTQSQAKFIFMGTSCAYSPDLELNENNYMAGEPIDSLYTYAMTKRMLYQGARSMEKQFNMRWLCTVPSTLYGPSYHLDGRQMHFIFDLIKKILRGKYLYEPVILWGDGYQRRELVHVKSFVNILIQLAEKVDNKLLNLGSGEDFSIREFVKVICDLVEYDSSLISYDINKYVGAKSKILAIEEIDNYIFQYKSKLIPLKVGLKETIDWFVSERAYLNTDEQALFQR